MRGDADPESRNSVIGVVTAEDGDTVVEEYENDDEQECNAEGGATDTVDGVGLTGGEESGDEGAAIGREELNDEKENDG